MRKQKGKVAAVDSFKIDRESIGLLSSDWLWFNGRGNSCWLFISFFKLPFGEDNQSLESHEPHVSLVFGTRIDDC